MAHSLSVDECRRLAARGPCSGILGLKGADSRYLRDCLVRQYLNTGFAALVRDLGEAATTTTSLVLESGIGTLTLDPAGTSFEPTIPVPRLDPAPLLPALQPTAPRRAPADLIANRHAVCHACARWVADRCTVAGCSCAGLGQPERQYSRCPEGRW